MSVRWKFEAATKGQADFMDRVLASVTDAQEAWEALGGAQTAAERADTIRDLGMKWRVKLEPGDATALADAYGSAQLTFGPLRAPMSASFDWAQAGTGALARQELS